MKLWAKPNYAWAEQNVGLWCPVKTNATSSAVLDSSLFGNDQLTLTNYSNVNTAWVGTDVGTAINFPGSAWAIPQNTRSVFPLGSSARTMACWFRGPNAGIGGQQIMAYGGNAGQGQRFGIWHASAVTIGCEISGTISRIPITRNNEYRLIVMTMDGTSSSINSVKISLDGVEGPTYTITGPATIDTRNTGMTFGTISGAPGNNNFLGQIAEAWILPNRLTPSEILSAYQAGPGGMWDYQPPRKRSYFAQVVTFKNYWFRSQQHMIGGGIR